MVHVDSFKNKTTKPMTILFYCALIIICRSTSTCHQTLSLNQPFHYFLIEYLKVLICNAKCQTNRRKRFRCEVRSRPNTRSAREYISWYLHNFCVNSNDDFDSSATGEAGRSTGVYLLLVSLLYRST
ncbi:hypothetical protein L798_08328 [Zootermopsis nevadensis]|uniref:Uncharacterized protein n=1 Tax=Zootermopsis nevadensis TaxID=136037 RepID=A0A067R388_ZOONE|nr:hypothetical protein L798_08328 [Zootermopsis nevadensis]